MTRPRPVQIYVAALAVTSAIILIWAIAHIDHWQDTLILGFLTALARSLVSRVRTSVAADLTASITVAAFILVGPAGAVLAAAFNFLEWRRGRPLSKRLYNGSQAVVDTSIAGFVYVALGGDVALERASGPGGELWEPQNILSALVAYAALLAVNALLLSVVLRLDLGARPIQVIRQTLAPTFVQMMGYGALGVLLAVLWDGMGGPEASVFMLVPLFIGHWAFAQFEAEQEAHKAAIEALAKMVETKDLYTRGHSERVSQGVLSMGRVMELPADRLQALTYAGLLHDVGKVGVPISVIRKSGALTDEEFAEIKRHPARGVELVGDISFLGEAQRGILHHHERFDGSGYPSGLAGTDIPEFARIIGIADAFDSMTTSRSYRSARTIEEARAELERCRGTHFDPRMVEVFIEGLDRFGWQAEVAAQFTAVPASDTVTIDHDDLPGVGAVPETAAADPRLVATGAGGSQSPREAGGG